MPQGLAKITNKVMKRIIEIINNILDGAFTILMLQQLKILLIVYTYFIVEIIGGSMIKFYKGVKGFALIRRRDGSLTVVSRAMAYRMLDAGTAIEIIEEAKTKDELIRKLSDNIIMNEDVKIKMESFKSKIKFKFNILKDGSRHLKGFIAEHVFLEVLRSGALRNKIIREGIMVCSTLDARNFLSHIELVNDEPWYIIYRYIRSINPLRYDSKVEGYAKLNDLISKLKVIDDPNSLIYELKCQIYNSFMKIGSSNLTFTNNEPKFNHCILCGKNKWNSPSDIPGLCTSCYERVKDKLTDKEKECLKEIVNLLIIRKYKDVLDVLSLMDSKDLSFLKRIYSYTWSQVPFDYIGVKLDGSEKYLIDVTSTTSKSIGGLSDNEKKVAKEALKVGFIILIVAIYFGRDWNVIIELKEYK